MLCFFSSRRRHTRYWRDWSSDVCSSDLGFVPSGDATIKSIAFALAAGIAFDAFVVRMVLVPAALALLGDRAWWLPRWLRWLPTLDVEGAALERPAARPQPQQQPEVVGAGER